MFIIRSVDLCEALQMHFDFEKDFSIYLKTVKVDYVFCSRKPLSFFVILILVNLIDFTLSNYIVQIRFFLNSALVFAA